MQMFCTNIKIIPKATRKVDTHVKGNDNGNILRIIITV